MYYLNWDAPEKTLQELKNLYDLAMENGDSQKTLIFYSKLAILELCAWIEEAQDKIILDYIQLRLLEASNINSTTELVKRNPSFDYKKFRELLIHILGIIALEKLEAKLEEETGTMQRIKSELGNLKSNRDELAHTHLKEITPRYNAPSVTYNNFLKIYDLLQKIELALNNL